MALYIKYDLHSDSEVKFESFEHLIFDEDMNRSYKDDYENYLNNKIKESEDELNERLA